MQSLPQYNASGIASFSLHTTQREDEDFKESCDDDFRRAIVVWSTVADEGRSVLAADIAGEFSADDRLAELDLNTKYNEKNIQIYKKISNILKYKLNHYNDEHEQAMKSLIRII